MKMMIPLIAMAGAFALGACSEPVRTEKATANEPDSDGQMSASQLRQAKTQCEIAAVTQGGTAKQAKTLCDCTVEKVAEGKSATEFNAVSEEEANAALDACAAENGIEAIK